MNDIYVNNLTEDEKDFVLTQIIERIGCKLVSFEKSECRTILLEYNDDQLIKSQSEGGV